MLHDRQHTPEYVLCSVVKADWSLAWILATLLMDICIRQSVGSIQQANPNEQNSNRAQLASAGRISTWLARIWSMYVRSTCWGWFQRFSFDTLLDCVWPTGRHQALLPTDSTLETAAIMQRIGPSNGCFQRLKKLKNPGDAEWLQLLANSYRTIPRV